ncbi:MAG: N-6 DNA methylase [Hyphomicrobiaceae bacterium]
MSKAPLNPKAAPAEIARHLQRITHQHFFRSFEDWLALAINAFLRDEPEYMKIMSRYGARTAPMGSGVDHPADHFARALGTWMQAMQSEPADYLGRVYEEQAVANSYAGQFFTPEPVVELMAAMTMPDDIADSAIVSDPACGSGRMLIAGIRRNRSATFIGTDTDLTCVHMTALNCLVRNANTWIIHGNSLSLETHGGLAVRRSPFGGELHRLTKDDTDRLIRLPFAKPDAATALTPIAPAIAAPTPEAKAALDEVAKSFPVDKKGQGDFGF